MKAINPIWESKNGKWAITQVDGTHYEQGSVYAVSVCDNFKHKGGFVYVEIIPEGTKLLTGEVAKEDEVNVFGYQIPKYVEQVIIDYVTL